jgi:hypothetical protein
LVSTSVVRQKVDLRRTFHFDTRIHPEVRGFINLFSICACSPVRFATIWAKWKTGLILEQSTEVSSIVLFRKLNWIGRWIPIFNLIKMRKILTVFNTLKTSWPPLKVPSVKTEQDKSKISYSGASLFNSLPSELKDIENHSINSCKKKLKPTFFN